MQYLLMIYQNEAEYGKIDEGGEQALAGYAPRPGIATPDS